MKAFALSTLMAMFGFVVYRLSHNSTIASLLYFGLSYILGFDQDVLRDMNLDGEVEEGGFTHRFMHLEHTFHGYPVNVTYHVVECGDEFAEPIVFGHGLGENWRVWKKIMVPFCSSHRVIAYDSEGMGQSTWANPIDDIPDGSSREFLADMQMEMLRRIGVRCFNLVITDYAFWTTLSMLTNFGNGTVLRYGKLQSTVGVEDPARIPQGKLMKKIPKIMDWLVNLTPHAMSRMLCGKPLIRGWKALDGNKRMSKCMDDKTFEEVILRGCAPGAYTSWVYFYNKGKDMVSQMDFQIDTFKNHVTFPVYILQGTEDKGQPIALFDGTAAMTIEAVPAVTWQEKRERFNHTHKVVTSYSTSGEPIGPHAADFFPNSPWVKYAALNGVGHFPHLEAPEAVIEALTELFRQPINHGFNTHQHNWCPTEFAFGGNV